MSLQIDKNSGFHLVYCFPTSLIVSLKYHHFTNKPANHCCQSLNKANKVKYDVLEKVLNMKTNLWVVFFSLI